MNEAPSALDKRLDDLGWGIFLMMIGVLWLMPEAWVPKGAWLLGTGVLLLALNAARYAKEIPVHPLTTILGVLALLAGFGEVMGVTLPLFAICLVLLGASIIVKPLISRHA